MAASERINGKRRRYDFDHINRFVNIFPSISQQKILQRRFSSLRDYLGKLNVV